jgi:hypothetical protein
MLSSAYAAKNRIGLSLWCAFTGGGGTVSNSNSDRKIPALELPSSEETRRLIMSTVLDEILTENPDIALALSAAREEGSEFCSTKSLFASAGLSIELPDVRSFVQNKNCPLSKTFAIERNLVDRAMRNLFSATRRLHDYEEASWCLFDFISDMMESCCDTALKTAEILEVR